MNKILHLDNSLLFNEGAMRRCYCHPDNENKCLKIAKGHDLINEHDLESCTAVKAILNQYIAVYDAALADTNLGKALVCEFIRDSDGQPSQSFAEYRKTQKTNQQLTDQFLDFFDLLQKNDLFFYDLNPKNFIVQRTKNREHLKYTDLKSLGKTKTALALEKTPYFARKKLKRRICRFIKRFLSPAEEETD